MIETIVMGLGLTAEEVDVYLALLSKGSLTAAGVAKASKVKRTYVYKVCEKLVGKGLVSLIKSGATTLFSPLPPDNLMTQAEVQKQKAEQAVVTLGGVMDELKAKYLLVDKRPLVKTAAGLAGIKGMYADILKEGKDLLLMRSSFDDSRPELLEAVSDQINAQVAKGIHTKPITPLEDGTKETFLHKDKDRLVARHIVRGNKFELPSQVLIYGSKVAIVSLREEVVVTVIDNPDINESFRKLFELLWEATEEEHAKIVSGWKIRND